MKSPWSLHMYCPHYRPTNGKNFSENKSQITCFYFYPSRTFFISFIPFIPTSRSLLSKLKHWNCIFILQMAQSRTQTCHLCMYQSAKTTYSDKSHTHTHTVILCPDFIAYNLQKKLDIGRSVYHFLQYIYIHSNEIHSVAAVIVYWCIGVNSTCFGP